jgi:plasmid maintenance system antidote protein VapI
MVSETDPNTALNEFVKKHGTQQKAADALDITQGYLSDLLRGRRDITDSVLEKLGYQRIVVKARKS